MICPPHGLTSSTAALSQNGHAGVAPRRSAPDGAAATSGSCSPSVTATSGGARALGKSATIGTLDPGKEADLVVIDLPALLPFGKNNGDGPGDLSPEDVLALCIYRGNPQATLETFVRGNCVYRAPHWPAPQ